MESNRTLAVVGTTTIRESDVNEMILSMGPRAESYNNPQGRAAVLEQLINQALFLQDARKNMMEYDPMFKAQLAKVKDDLLFQFAVSKAVEKVKVSDEDIKTYFEAHPEQFQGKESAVASHILVSDEAKCAELLEQIQKGEISFEDAAKANSSCPSGQSGGSLGEFTRGQMVPEFEEAVFEMEAGELRGPVKTQFGYHLIRLDERKAAEPMKLSDVKEALRDHLLSEKQKQAFQSKLNQLKIMYPVMK